MDGPRLNERRSEVLVETLRKFLQRDARANISKLLGRIRPADVAGLLRSLGRDEQLEVFRILTHDFPEGAGEALTEMEPPQRLALLERLEAEEIAAVLERLAVDDAVFLVESLPEELHVKVLSLVDLRNLTDVQTHLAYRDDTAGRIMSLEYFALPETATAREAIAAIQEQSDAEMIFYLYVVDGEGHLVGVTSLRQLLLSSPDRTLSSFMTRATIKVHTDTDQEEVAQLAARYDLLAIPVTDDGNHLVGIVTVDDIVDVVKEEATEDLLKMAGTSEEELLYERRSLRIARLRLPSVLVSMVGLLVTGLLLQNFQAEMGKALFLLAFVPVVMGLGGSIGGQASTVTVRGLASGRIGRDDRPIRTFLGQQLRVGAILGAACAALVGVAAGAMTANVGAGLTVGAAVFVALVVAAIAGAVVPLSFQKLGIDPAVASGPLLSTVTDITGILIYYGLAAWLLLRLGG